MRAGGAGADADRAAEVLYGRRGARGRRRRDVLHISTWHAFLCLAWLLLGLISTCCRPTRNARAPAFTPPPKSRARPPQPRSNQSIFNSADPELQKQAEWMRSGASGGWAGVEYVVQLWRICCRGGCGWPRFRTTGPPTALVSRLAARPSRPTATSKRRPASPAGRHSRRQWAPRSPAKRACPPRPARRGGRHRRGPAAGAGHPAVFKQVGPARLLLRRMVWG